MPRLFVALTLPDDLRTMLSTLPARFDGARWVRQSNLHMTLVFIGETPSDKAADIETALEQVRSPSFDLRVTGLGRFPSDRARPPRVVWAATTHPAELQRLYEATMVALLPYAVNDATPFTPHITLARVTAERDGHAARRARRFMEINAATQSAPFRVASFSLMSSRVTADGAIYEPVRTFPLAP